MASQLQFEILAQPDDTTCGPTCLHAVYRYYDDDLELHRVVKEVRSLQHGGTLGVLLGCHALRRGYPATIYTFNLQVFDPTWFADKKTDVAAKLRAQMAFKQSDRLRVASEGYLEFLSLGGEIRFEDLTPGLIRRYLTRGVPILTGLSATYLYQCKREFGPKDDEDDVRGEPVGHFVVLCGYDRSRRTVSVADPQLVNPLGRGHMYDLPVDRVLSAILLGELTYDANLLVLEPAETHADRKG